LKIIIIISQSLILYII